MDYKKAVSDTLNGMKGSFRPESDAEFGRKIRERAKIMSNNNDNVRHINFREITPEYVEPKKSHKALKVVAGVAGTAAVLAGAVFGLKWLNDNGGLKGPDVQGSAGYHDVGTSETTTAVPYSEPDAVVTTTTLEQITDYYTSDTTFRVGNYNVSVTGYQFNTVFLRLYYTVTRKDGGAITETEAYGIPSWYGTDTIYTVINHVLTVRDDTSASFVVDIIPDEPTHSLDVPFINGEGAVCGSFVAKCDNSNYVFRLPCDVKGVDPHISELFISQSEVILKYTATDDNPDFIVPSVRVYMKGDYPISFADSRNDFYDSQKKVGYQYSGLAEPCDTSNIGKIYIGDVLVYETPDIQYPVTSQETVAETSEVAELLDFSSRTVRMEDYRYDGHILAAKLVGEADVINGKSLAFRSVSNPRNLVQGCLQEDGGTYTLWALLDVPEGQTDTIEIVEIPPASEGYEVGATITVDGTATSSPGIVLDADMSGYGLPGVTLESMRLSTYGLELMFSCDKANGAQELHVEILLGDVMVPIREISGVVPYDETDGLYHACKVVTAENMFGFDLSAASSVSVNGLKVSGDELTPGGADNRPGIYETMPRRNTAE